jgi:hypothetical protein
MTSFRTLMGAAVLIFVSAAGADAQQSRIAAEQDLNAAVVERGAVADQDRQQLRELLQRPEVRSVAERQGIDPDRLADAAGTLSESELERIAPLMQGINGDLAGGQTITFTTTALILVLLIVILLILVT